MAKATPAGSRRGLPSRAAVGTAGALPPAPHPSPAQGLPGQSPVLAHAPGSGFGKEEVSPASAVYVYMQKCKQNYIKHSGGMARILQFIAGEGAENVLAMLKAKIRKTLEVLLPSPSTSPSFTMAEETQR